MLKTLFFGTSTFAVPSLRVAAARTDLAGVVTQPDRPGGRGHKLQPTPVKLASGELGLRVFEPVSMRAFAEELLRESFDLFALASYGRILPQSLLDGSRLGALNVHPSLLPRYRGATPIQTALANGDRETGVSIMLMDAGMDTGPIVLQRRVAIDAEETYGELHDRLASVGAELLGQALSQAQAGPIVALPQSGEASITKPLRKDDLQLNWSDPARELAARVRSLAPAPSARGFIGGQSIKVLRARAVTSDGAPAGTPLRIEGDALVVGTGDGGLAILELIAPGRGRESGAAFWRRVGAGQAN